MGTRVLAVGFAIVFAVTADVQAQSSPRGDAAVITGSFVGHPTRDPPTASYDHWYHTGQFGLTAARYFTTHLKAEGEVAMTGEGQRYVTRLVPVPGGGTYPVSSEQMIRARSASGVLTWQFLENQWVHPFVSAGAGVDFERTRLHTWRQSQYRGDPRIPGNETVVSQERTDDLGTTPHVRGILGAGAKLYVTPRAFFRTDARVGIGKDGSNVALRLGFGVDF